MPAAYEHEELGWDEWKAHNPIRKGPMYPGRIIRMGFSIRIIVEKHPTNETQGNSWVPDPFDVSSRIATALQRGTDDYGWDIIRVEPDAD